MIKKLITTLAFLITAITGYSQQTTRLNSNWEFIRQDLGGIWEAVRPVPPGGPESVPLWQNVTLPHCFNARDAVDPDVNYYQGPGWYRTQLAIANPYGNGRTLLHFEGAGQKTDVYVYTTKVTSHLGGYDEWTADITEAVAAFKKTEAFQKQFKGKVPVSIRCDNSRDLETIPSQMSDFNVYGGLYRYVNLVYQPLVSVNKLFAAATLSKDLKEGWIDVKATFDGLTQAQNALGNVVVKDAAGKTVGSGKYVVSSPAFQGTYSLSKLRVGKPKIWSPSSPYLYTVQITATANGETFTQTEKIGFRNFEFTPHGPFMLNGKRLRLRGTHRHEDHAGVGAAMTEAMMRQEMQLMKDMGVNFIRLGHYQQSRIVLNLCDSLGILAWEEEPWCRGGLGGPGYQEQARQMMTNMIEQHYNHPAIILWGLGNENDWEGDFAEFDKEKIRTFMKEQNDLAHKLDPSRMTSIRRCEFCKDIPDVYSPSIWAGWYRAKYTDYKQISEDEFNKNNRFFHAEWGGDSHAGRHAENPDTYLNTPQPTDPKTGKTKDPLASKDGDWSETYICNLFDWHLKEQENMPWLSGSAFWTFKDFSTPLRPDNPIPYVNQKGVVSRDMTLKESYYVFQSYWTDKPMAHIYGHTWPTRWGNAGEKKQIKVYSNCTQAELFVNGKSYGTKKRNSQDFPAAGLRWDVPLSAGSNAIKVIAKKGNVIITDEIKQDYQTEKWNKPAKLVLEQVNSQNGTTTAQVKLLDEKGIPCLDAINWITFRLTGDGELLDDLGTSGGSRRVQAYNGRATIQVKTMKGQSILSVQSPGMSTVFLNLAGK
ncbi:glycoside hydrolase family 2 TIM barrel-domain containing protein [Mucilaginibacter galii]|uniref:Beta-galactosidase n=1 Tax=Mucilaginibacter galii TaxID=2005073 RepID=A0A917J9P0_9SPHI|nr:glycoside hydrolase family 2 TIM barrel-domain containing protein [Mucilaginibacter galii]GGI50520.1 beta-galactosidase [Mucilaginibacter galii]